MSTSAEDLVYREGHHLDGSVNMPVFAGVEALLAAVDGLAPEIRARGEEIERGQAIPADLHDKLVATGSPITAYDITRKDQIKWHFTDPNSTGFHSACTRAK